MEKSDWINLVVIHLNIWIATYSIFLGLKSVIEKEARNTRIIARAMQEAHQDWLFNQLYTMAPGKVLKPDEIEPKTVSKKATIINRGQDPYNEFNGRKDDWHE